MTREKYLEVLWTDDNEEPALTLYALDDGEMEKILDRQADDVHRFFIPIQEVRDALKQPAETVESDTQSDLGEDE